MFKSAALKLTLWYLAIIMALSIGFSFAIYRLSSSELDRSASRPSDLYNLLFGPNNPGIDSLRTVQAQNDKNHLRSSLILFNGAVLLLGGGASYFLARRTLKPLEETLELQKRFTGDASHELRTPLTAMQAEIEVALRNPGLGQAEAIDLLKSNLEEVGKLKSLSEGLLELATAGKDVPNEHVSLKNVASEAIGQVSKRAKARRIVIKNSSEDIKVTGNHQQILNLLSILLDNAVKYSPKGGVVKLSAKTKDRQAHISVTDHGQGIAARDLPHIFERFYRADKARSYATTGGHGLGLAIAQKITQLHKGQIDVRSAPGKGSTFTVRLPLARPLRSSLGKM